MIKRYGLGAKAEKITDKSAQFGLVGIVERPDGEYYKASDVDAILESIGAGGVSSKSAKTVEQHRAEFEEWVASEFKGEVLHKEMIARYAGNNDLYHHSQTSQLWRAWQAARGLKP